MARFKRFIGFTLSELLIALAILGLIATFTIPKVLQQIDSIKKKAISKEAASILANAYETYLQTHEQDPSVSFVNLLPYVQYEKSDPTAIIDDAGTYGTSDVCNSPSEPCIRLQNGAIIQYNTASFGGTGNNNAIYFVVDPDGKFTKDGSVIFFLYYSRRLTSWKYAAAGTTTSVWTPGTGNDPAWFSW